jgi:hypothetical protein
MKDDQKQINVDGNEYPFTADIPFIPLLKKLNKVGLKTISHCSGNSTKFKNEKHLIIQLQDGSYIKMKPKQNTMELGWRTEKDTEVNTLAKELTNAGIPTTVIKRDFPLQRYLNINIKDLDDVMIHKNGKNLFTTDLTIIWKTLST